jgi:hypothetical protein
MEDHILTILFLRLDAQKKGRLTRDALDELEAVAGIVLPGLEEALSNRASRRKLLGITEWLEIGGAVVRAAPHPDEALRAAREASDDLCDSFPPLDAHALAAEQAFPILVESAGPSALHTLVLAALQGNLPVVEHIVAVHTPPLATARIAGLSILEVMRRCELGAYVPNFALASKPMFPRAGGPLPYTPDDKGLETCDEEAEAAAVSEGEQDEQDSEEELEGEAEERNAQAQSLVRVQDFLLAHGAEPPAHTMTAAAAAMEKNVQQLVETLSAYPIPAVVLPSPLMPTDPRFACAEALDMPEEEEQAFKDALRTLLGSLVDQSPMPSSPAASAAPPNDARADASAPHSLKNSFFLLVSRLIVGQATLASVLHLLGSLPAERQENLILGDLAAIVNEQLSPEGGPEVASRLYCQVCHKVLGVAPCPRCGLTAYCSARHAHKDSGFHQHLCGRLLAARSFALLRRARAFTATVAEALGAASAQSHPPLQMAGACVGPEAWESVFARMELAPSDLLLCAAVSESWSFLYTAAYALTRLGLESTSALCISILGADREVHLRWDALLSLLPNVEHLTILFVGPELPAVDAASFGQHARYTPIFVRGTLHGCEDALQGAPPPHAVFAMNSGIHFYESWVPTLEAVLSTSVPFVVTAWTFAEGLVVRQILKQLGGSVMEREGLDLHENPFASRLPCIMPDNHGHVLQGNLALLAVCGNASAARPKSKKRRNF